MLRLHRRGAGPYLSNGWEVYFWCNNFSNTAHGCGLSGRDYSYFTLTFNERQTVIQRRELCERLLEFLDTHFKNHPNLHVAVQYSTWYDTKKLKGTPERCSIFWMGAAIPTVGKRGDFFLENGDLLFRPKYAKRTVYRVDRADILTICWELGLIADNCSEDSHSASAEINHATTLLPL